MPSLTPTRPAFWFRHNRAAADKKYACREACQVAFSTACDRVRPNSARPVPSAALTPAPRMRLCAFAVAHHQAFPPTMEGGSSNYQVCLAFLDGSCEDTCAAFK